jgi:hypothetical protein
MRTEFTASQTVDLGLSDEPIPMEQYLRQPQRLIYALTEPGQVEQLGPSLFRLTLSPLKFMMLKIQPTVDLKVWTEADGALYLQSVGTQLKGLEIFDASFHLNLTGYLAACHRGGVTHLRGQSDLLVQVDLPPSLVFMSRTLVQATGNALLKSVLTTMRQRLERQLIQDYYRWVKAQKADAQMDLSGGRSPGFPYRQALIS